MTDRISRALILISIDFVALVSLPAFAVWLMPQYSGNVIQRSGGRDVG